MASRFVTFRLSLHEAISDGTFPSSGTVSVRGNFTNWEPVYFLLDNDADGIFSATIPVQGNAGDTIVFKYVLAVGTQETWETLADRQYTLGPTDVTAFASAEPHIFNKLTPIAPQNLATGSRVFSLALETLPQASPYRAYVFDNVVGWNGNAPVTDRGLIFADVLPASDAAWSTLATAVSSGTGTGFFGCTLDSLTAATEYFYRTFATNSQGTTLGPIESFTTAAAPVSGASVSATLAESSTAKRKSTLIDWLVAASPQPSYKVYLERLSPSGVTSRILDANPSLFEDESVSAAGTYEYFIGLDFGAGGRSAAISTGAITISAWTAPSAPVASGVSQLPGTALLTWNTNASAAFYEVSLGTKTLGQTEAAYFLASHLPGDSYLSADEGGTHIGTAQFVVTAFNGGGLSSSTTAAVPILAPLKFDGTANPAKVRPDRTNSRLLLLAKSAQFSSSSTSRVLQPSEPERALWAMKTSSSAQFEAGASRVGSYFVNAEDLSGDDWLLDNTVMSTVNRSFTATLQSHTAPKVVPRYADANFPASYAGHLIDGRKYQTLINARIYNDTNEAAEFVTEGYLMPGAHLTLRVLFYTNFKGTILRIGGPTAYYRLFSKVGLFGAQTARGPNAWTAMTQLINADMSQNFVKTSISAGEEELVVFRIYVPAYMGGSSTTLVVAAERS